MWGWDVWIRCCLPPPPRMHFSSSIFGRLGGGAWEQSSHPLLSPFLGTGPLSQQAARACPGVTPRGGCGQEQGTHSIAVAASGQPTGWPGVVRGGDWPGPGERDLGLRQTETETETQTGRLMAWAASLATLVPLHQGFEAGLLPAKLQPRLDPAEPGTCSPAPKLSRPKGGILGHSKEGP